MGWGFVCDFSNAEQTGGVITCCVVNTSCDFASVRKMYIVTWVLTEKCELDLGSCLENAGCRLAHV